MHLKPAAGKPRPVGQAIVDQLFPAQQDGRIPIIGVAGKSDTTAVAQLLAHLVCLNNEYVGLASQAGLFLGRRKVMTDNRANWHEARKLLLNPAVESAIIETPVRALLSEGLPYDRCQIAILTGIDQNEDLSEFAISTEEKRYNTYRTFVDVVLPSGAAILNAADAQLVPMAELCDGAVIFYAEDNLCPALSQHRAAQGSLVTIIDGSIHLQQGDGDIDFGSVAQFSHIPAPVLLASLAAAWALNIDLELIRAGLHAYP
jgi:cyanophycin synthetase